MNEETTTQQNAVVPVTGTAANPPTGMSILDGFAPPKMVSNLDPANSAEAAKLISTIQSSDKLLSEAAGETIYVTGFLVQERQGQDEQGYPVGYVEYVLIGHDGTTYRTSGVVVSGAIRLLIQAKGFGKWASPAVIIPKTVKTASKRDMIVIEVLAIEGTVPPDKIKHRTDKRS